MQADLSYSFCHCSMQQLNRDSFAELLFRDNRKKMYCLHPANILFLRATYVLSLSVKTSVVMDGAPYSSSRAFPMKSYFLLLPSDLSFPGSLVLEHLLNSFPLNLVHIPTQATSELYL